MGDVVNLKRIRKRTEHDQATKQAEVNRARFGRTKVERAQAKERSDRASAMLEQHRLAPEDDR